MTAPSWYGVKTFRLCSSKDELIAGYIFHRRMGRTGQMILDDTFSVVLGKGDSVGNGKWRKASFTMQLVDNLMSTGIRSGRVQIYKCTRDAKPDFIDNIGT